MSVCSKNTIYKVTVLNWEKHNGRNKKGHTYFLLSKRFFDDAKILSLPIGGRLLYVGLIAACSDLSSSCIEASYDQMLRYAGGKGQHIQRLLDQLQELQLVTYEKFSPFLNRIEDNRKEIEKKIITSGVKKPALDGLIFIDDAKSKKLKSDPVLNKRVKESFVEAYRSRYKVDPVINAKFNAAISSLVKRLGVDDAVSVVKFYLTHNDSFYLKTTHSISVCLRDCESLRTQMLRNRPITTNDVRNFEKADHYKSQMERIERGEI